MGVPSAPRIGLAYGLEAQRKILKTDKMFLPSCANVKASMAPMMITVTDFMISEFLKILSLQLPSLEYLLKLCDPNSSAIYRKN